MSVAALEVDMKVAARKVNIIRAVLEQEVEAAASSTTTTKMVVPPLLALVVSSIEFQ